MTITGYTLFDPPHVVWWHKFEGVVVIAYSNGSWIVVPRL
jgi:hypothetical protein